MTSLNVTLFRTRCRGMFLRQSLKSRHMFQCIRGFVISPFSSSPSSMATAPTSSSPSSERSPIVQEPSDDNCGSIDLIFGPMFAGKSTELLRRVFQAEKDGYRVALVKSHKDKGRYSDSHIVTHDGLRRSCVAAESLMALRSEPSPYYSSADVIAIDEAQFFSDLLEFCMLASEVDGKHVLVSGLDGDFKRSKFGQILDLIPLADTVTKLRSKCRFCQNELGISRPALFSLRLQTSEGGWSSQKGGCGGSTELGDQEQQVVIGGAETYAPVCRSHYYKLYRKMGS